MDGYAEVDGKRIIYEYNGCAYHSCEKCSSVRVVKNDETARKDFFQNLPNSKIISTSGCDWYIEKLNLKTFQPSITPLLWSKTIETPQLLEMVQTEKVYGFVVCDISKNKDAQKWMNVNFPPILQKDQVLYEDLPRWMQELYNKEDFPIKTIFQKMHAKQLLLHTSLLKFYLENGFTVDKIYKFYEYQGAECFKTVFDTVYRARVEATEIQDDIKATAVKLVSNSMYGSLLLVSY